MFRTILACNLASTTAISVDVAFFKKLRYLCKFLPIALISHYIARRGIFKKIHNVEFCQAQPLKRLIFCFTKIIIKESSPKQRPNGFCKKSAFGEIP